MPDDGDKPRSERCGNCRFWDNTSEDPDGRTPEWGVCHCFPRVYAPRVVDEPGVMGNWRFPPHTEDDWCGEWQAKEGAADWRTLTLEEADLPYRAVTILERAGIKTLGEVMGYSGVALLQLPYFGETLLGYVRTALSRYGAKLRGD